MPAAAASESVPRYPPGTPGTSAIRLGPQDLNGLWTLSFGHFGWKEYDSRGAILQIENGRVFGGGGHFVYQGSCAVIDAAVELRIEVGRYRTDPNFSDATGLRADHYSLRCTADAITRDHFEGRISNEVRTIGGDLQEITLALVRYAPL